MCSIYVVCILQCTCSRYISCVRGEAVKEQQTISLSEQREGETERLCERNKELLCGGLYSGIAHHTGPTIGADTADTSRGAMLSCSGVFLTEREREREIQVNIQMN